MSDGQESREWTGLVAAPGMALGRARIIQSSMLSTPERSISDSEMDAEARRFDQAVDDSREQMEALLEESDLSDDMRAIFEAQLLLLEDPMLIQESRDKIRGKKINAEQAIAEETRILKGFLLQSDKAVFRERATDLEDMGNRILSNLMGIPDGDLRIPLLRGLPEDTILVANDLSASLLLHARNLAGIVVEEGGVTGHLGILAHSLGIPCIVRAEGIVQEIQHDDRVLLDGEQGLVVVHPRAHHLEGLRSYERSRERRQTERIQSPVEMADGTPVELWANVSDLDATEDERLIGTHGIGLFRTEFLYLKEEKLFLDADAQTETYATILNRLGDKPVTFRLLDAGDDKPLPSRSSVRERHLRGVRLLLANPDLLKMQLRSIMRAAIETGVSGDRCRIMVPMVSVLEEMEKVRLLVSEVEAEFRGGPTPPRLLIGAMIETPAAVMMCDALASQADFFSVGTNDLTRWLLAINRESAATHDELFYQPSLYRLMNQLMKSTHRPVTICGELAARGAAIPLLLGLGVRRLSVSVTALFDVARIVSRCKVSSCEEMAEAALRSSNVSELRQVME